MSAETFDRRRTARHYRKHWCLTRELPHFLAYLADRGAAGIDVGTDQHTVWWTDVDPNAPADAGWTWEGQP